MNLHALDRISLSTLQHIWPPEAGPEGRQARLWWSGLSAERSWQRYPLHFVVAAPDPASTHLRYG